MPNFTAQLMAEAHEEPVLRLDTGSQVLTFHGRVLSAPQWFPFLERYQELGRRAAASEGDEDSRDVAAQLRAQHQLHVDYLRAVFPKSRFRWWAPDPVKLLEHGHPRRLAETFERFFAHQVRVGQRGLSDESPTDGTSSPPRTPSAPDEARAE